MNSSSGGAELPAAEPVATTSKAPTEPAVDSASQPTADDATPEKTATTTSDATTATTAAEAPAPDSTSLKATVAPAAVPQTTATSTETTAAPQEGDSTVFIPAGSVWKYFDKGTDLGTAWRELLYDDSLWASGPAQLGYGDGDEKTVVGYGTDAANKYITTYFRRSFNVKNAAAYKTLALRLLRDDGAVVYLNGKEAFRSNMPAGAINYKTTAPTGIADAAEKVYQDKMLDPALLVDGTNIISVEIHQDSPASSDISFDAELVGSTVVPLVASGSAWKYFDKGADLGTAWRAPSFDDSAWASGNAQLGYGDGDEATVVGYGPDAANKYITTYFRRSFNVSDPAIYKGLRLKLLRDDGAVVYLNGKEVFRSNMPAGAVTATTPAMYSNGENVYQEKSIDPSLLVGGTNVIAVEVHQETGSSSDISFDLELSPYNPAALIPAGSVWRYLDNGSDQGTAWRTSAFNDSLWASGPAQLGYGDGDETTVVGYGTDAANKYITTYFRRSFKIGDPAAFKQLKLRLLRDDGAVVYLNGKEVFRSNMPTGAINYKTTASANPANENVYEVTTIDPSFLVKGTNVMAVEIHQDSPTSSDISFDAELIASKETLADAEGAWKYFANGTDLGSAWRAPSFDDSTWPVGSAELGYGDGDEATVVGYGTDAANKYITTYFRRSFNVADASVYRALALRLLRDDGAVVYLNGKEVFRTNMPAGTVSYNTLAADMVSAPEESIYVEKAIDPSLLVNGTNVLAVEIHQDSPNSSDASFALELLSTNSPPRVNLTAPANGAAATGPVNINVTADAFDDDGTVTKVDFYANSKLIGTAAAAPYQITWGNVAAGSYALTAVATDDAGATTVSRVVNITVNQGAVAPGQPPLPATCKTADVVALDQAFYYNRLGAFNPGGMIYALRRDVVPVDAGKGIAPGNVQLRADKRPRPLVLRMNVGDCLQVNFQNLLAPAPVNDNQPQTRSAALHVIGMQPVNTILDDGSNLGTNPSGLVSPGGTATYTFFAEREGNHLLYSSAATSGGEGDGGSLAFGLFGSLNVEPKGAEYFRSQITAEELKLATAGSTPDGHPIINYNAVYPAGHRFAGLPILNMLQNGQLVHSDLNAVITGPNHGRFPAGTYRQNATEPDRDQPFREFTVVYHDEVKAVQAFPQYDDPVLSHTLHSVRDAFAINYGIGGIGSEIIANRIGVGPMFNCTECKYEEFFLTAWAIGDPAQLVDVPANARDAAGNLLPGAKATKVFYPDDPSNVHHSYIGDHVKMRVVHAGPKEHHIHHLHAHQWLRTPDDDNSSYLDSQALGPGYSFTTEIAHGGSGNRNQTVGDSIFHCHFYPHFAQGMWELWRSHDVFESGTALDGDGRPAAGSRALPDGEIAAGTPIPALVPVPTLAMAPLPEAQVAIVNGQAQITGTGNPGYPFFVPGVAGHRPPHPPLDTIDDGGLPRHVITGGTTHHVETRLDFSKELLTATAEARPETGTSVEVAAMNYHAQRLHPSFTPEGTSASYVTNGLPAVAGAPFADPCMDDKGAPAGTPRTYKAALIQTDIKLNKAGWHFPQSRILTLWGDVAATRNGQRPPEPFFFRANTNDCITFHHTVLTPNVYEQDDFQVRTPTDIMGQHIHLVKFDVTASDGAGNGWNYEDGTFAPDEVIERINAINRTGGLKSFGADLRTTLSARAHPYFGTLGAQTTVQRWYADNTLNNNGVDRTLRTVFTHDHFGPSTHQQAGLYGGLVVEPQGSQWRHSESGQLFGGRFDGGPTSWRADILTSDQSKSYREFLLEFADYQLAYQAGGGIDATTGRPAADPARAINPPVKKEVGLPFIVEAAQECPGGVPLPCPEAVSAADPGTMSVNYRNEPLALRLRDPNTNTQAAGEAGDLSHAYRSNVKRADALFNAQPSFYPALTGGVQAGDPFTPLLRAYEDDKVQIRILVGAHEEGHNFSVNGVRWLFEPGTPEDPASVNNSGYRNNQMMGISEHYEFVLPKMAKNSIGAADYLYQPGAAVDDQWHGLWGIMRAYNSAQPDLQPLPNNPNGHGPAVSNPGDFNGVCPRTAPVKTFEVAAVSAQTALPGGTLVYNGRTNQGGQLHDPTAIIFVRSSDLDASGRLLAGVPVEPLVLRANAGDCIQVTLTNTLPGAPPDLDGYNTLPMLVEHFNANQVAPSGEVGLHAQLLHYDVTRSNGVNVGFNPVQTAKAGLKTTYQWYAGEVSIDSTTGVGTARPIEFGATNLTSSDPIKHSNKGAVGTLIVEPQGAAWVEDANTRAQATVTKADGTTFREFVLVFQNDVNLRMGAGTGTAVPNLAGEEDAEDSGQKGFNYRTEPLWKRMGYAAEATLESTRGVDYTSALTNAEVGGEPVTPVFTAKAGQAVRMRVVMPAGHARNNVFQLHGHIWEEEPYVNNSTALGTNPLSEWKGAQYGVGPGSHFDLLLKNGAGGYFRVAGDYLYRTQQSFQFDGGLWGIFRVTP